MYINLGGRGTRDFLHRETITCKELGGTVLDSHGDTCCTGANCLMIEESGSRRMSTDILKHYHYKLYHCY